MATEAAPIVIGIVAGLVGSGGVAGIVTARVNSRLAAADEAVKKADAASLTVDAAGKAVELVTRRLDDQETEIRENRDAINRLQAEFHECERHRRLMEQALRDAGIEVPE